MCGSSSALGLTHGLNRLPLARAGSRHYAWLHECYQAPALVVVLVAALVAETPPLAARIGRMPLFAEVPYSPRAPIRRGWRAAPSGIGGRIALSGCARP